MKKQDKKYFKAFIRVVKSINQVEFGSENIVAERLIMAKDKDEVKQFLLQKYPQFFPDNKVYQKETKDTAQFFYVVIFPLYEWEKEQVVKDTSWKCCHCGQKYENTYLHRPRKYEKLFGGKVFCGEEDYCLNEHKKEYYKDVEYPDDEYHVSKDSPNYIYKITEKATSKCYIGKTRNAPFFRWWNHLTHSSSPFGIYLRNNSKLSDWTFEVLEILPAKTEDSVIFGIESKYIKQYDSIKNGFNTLISNKATVLE